MIEKSMLKTIAFTNVLALGPLIRVMIKVMPQKWMGNKLTCFIAWLIATHTERKACLFTVN